ncbi:hypothetical protein [Aeoliella sp. SH292]|uniref:hypothetical protein n=1 Tax=Aeoliella sp. SH292 TaxID=3454464 RepID=UPI003F99B9AC
MSITVAEKTHWKERIAQKIERAIKELVAKHDPQYLERIAKEARELAIELLGGTDTVARLRNLQEKQKALETDIDNIQSELAAIATKHGATPSRTYYGSRDDAALWQQAVDTRQEAAERTLLLKDFLGQQILKLRGEQESLLDTVWLSTSNAQIRELWKNVTDLVSGELSELQKKVLLQATDSQEGGK